MSFLVRPMQILDISACVAKSSCGCDSKETCCDSNS